MMQTADLRNRYHSAAGRWFDFARLAEYRRLREEAWALATGAMSADSAASAPDSKLGTNP